MNAASERRLPDPQRQPHLTATVLPHNAGEHDLLAIHARPFLPNGSLAALRPLRLRYSAAEISFLIFPCV
jgi:hypothetical protein